MRQRRPAPTATTEVRHGRAWRRVTAVVLGAGLVAGTFATPVAAQAVTESVFRFYNRQTGTHFYTISAAERDRVIGAHPQFAYEGAMFAAYAQAGSGAVPVFRFYNKETGTHFYTKSVSERDGVIAFYPQSFLRQLDAVSDGNRLYEPARAMGQDVYYAPSVFNYYPADYLIPGTTLVAPQFGIHNTNTVLHRANFVQEMIDDGGWSPDTELAGAVGTKVDLTPFRNVATDPAQLVTLINARLFGGGMPIGIRDEIFQAVAALPPTSRGQRARTALFLALTSFQYQVMR